MEAITASNRSGAYVSLVTSWQSNPMPVVQPSAASCRARAVIAGAQSTPSTHPPGWTARAAASEAAPVPQQLRVSSVSFRPFG
jgi:hypothetical protein